MTKKVVTSVFIVILLAFGIITYQYNDFKKSKPLNEWCDTKLSPSGTTFSFIKFSLFNQRLDPEIAFLVDGKPGDVLRVFESMQLPPTYSFEMPLRKNALNYANIVVAQIPQSIADEIKHANKVEVVFFSNNTSISCDVPDSILKEWQAKIK